MFKHIKTQEDIRAFLEKTNQLHDGYLTSAVYTNNGIKKTENGYSHSPWMTTLTLRIFVTSQEDATVEIEFEGLYEWQIKDNGSSIFAAMLSFDGQGRIVWADDVWQTANELGTRSYVIAGSMRWKLIKT